MLLQPSWPRVYFGEALTLRCYIEGGEDAEWEYLWSVPKEHNTDVKSRNEYRISFATGAHAGDYMCSGRMKNHSSAAKWSAPLRLTVVNSKSFSRAQVGDIGPNVTAVSFVRLALQ